MTGPLRSHIRVTACVGARHAEGFVQHPGTSHPLRLENAGTSPQRPGSLASECRVSREHQVRLGPNAYGEQLRPGRVVDCYLAILLDQPLAEIAPEPGRVPGHSSAGLTSGSAPRWRCWRWWTVGVAARSRAWRLAE